MSAVHSEPTPLTIRFAMTTARSWCPVTWYIFGHPFHNDPYIYVYIYMYYVCMYDTFRLFRCQLQTTTSRPTPQFFDGGAAFPFICFQSRSPMISFGFGFRQNLKGLVCTAASSIPDFRVGGRGTSLRISCGFLSQNGSQLTPHFCPSEILWISFTTRLGANFKLQPAIPPLSFLMVVLPFHSSVSKAEVQWFHVASASTRIWRA